MQKWCINILSKSNTSFFRNFTVFTHQQDVKMGFLCVFVYAHFFFSLLVVS